MVSQVMEQQYREQYAKWYVVQEEGDRYLFGMISFMLATENVKPDSLVGSLYPAESSLSSGGLFT